MRRVLLSITNLFLFLLLMFFIVVSSIEEITIDTLYNTMLPAQIRQTVNQYNPNITLTQDDVKTVIKNYVDIALNKKSNIEKEIEDVINKYELNNNQKENIIKIYQDEAIKLKLTMIQDTNQYNKKMINLYNWLTQKTTKIIFYIVILILVILLIIIEKSFIEWILKLGFHFLIIGFSYMFMFPSIVSSVNTGIEINYHAINNYGAKYASIGIVLILIFCILETINIKFFIKEENE